MNRFFLSTVFTERTFTKGVLVSWGLLLVLVLLATLPTSAMPINPNNYGTHRDLWPLTYGNWWEFIEESYATYNATNTECGDPDNSHALLTVEPPDGMGRFIGSRIIHSYKENPCIYHGTVADRNHDGTVTDEWRMQISHNTGTNVRWTIPHPKDETDLGLNTLYLQLQSVFLSTRRNTTEDKIPYLTNYSGSYTFLPDSDAWSNIRGWYDNYYDQDVEPSIFGVRVSDKGGSLSVMGASNSVRGYDFVPLTSNIPEQADTANDIIPDAVYASYGGKGKTQTGDIVGSIFPHDTRGETTADNSGLLDGINVDFGGLKQNADITRNPDDNDGLIWYVEYQDNVGLWDIPYYFNGVYAFEIDILETSINDVTDNDGSDSGVCESWYFVDGAGPVKIQNSHFEIPDVSGGTFNKVAQQYLNDCFKWTSYPDNRPAYNECNGGCNDNNDPYEWSYTGKIVLQDRYVASLDETEPIEPVADFHMDPPNAMTGINWNVGGGSPIDDQANDEILYFSNGLAWVRDLNRGTMLWSGLATDILSTSSLDYVRVESCAGCGGSLTAPWNFNGPDAVVYSPTAVQTVFPNCVGTTTGKSCNIIVYNGDSSLPDYGGNGAVWSGYFDSDTHTIDWADKSTPYTGQLKDVFPNAQPVTIDGQSVQLYDGQGIEAMTNPDWSDSYIVLTRAGAYWYFGANNSWPYRGDLGAVWNSAAPNLYDMDGPADPDAMMVFKNNEGFTDSPPQTYDNQGIEAVPSSTQWILAQGPAFWVKYAGQNWETWNGCEVGPENECP